MRSMSWATAYAKRVKSERTAKAMRVGLGKSLLSVSLQGLSPQRAFWAPYHLLIASDVRVRLAAKSVRKLWERGARTGKRVCPSVLPFYLEVRNSWIRKAAKALRSFALLVSMLVARGEVWGYAIESSNI